MRKSQWRHLLKNGGSKKGGSKTLAKGKHLRVPREIGVLGKQKYLQHNIS